MRKTLLALAAFSVLPSLAASRMRVSGLATGGAVEATTNVAFAAGGEVPRKLLVSLALAATPSNNVEVSFGCDADGDGSLAAEESGLTIGWDSGVWFVRDEAEDLCLRYPQGTAQDLSLALLIRPSGDISAVSGRIANDGEAFDAALRQGVLRFGCRWNRARVTVRGRNTSCEDVSAKLFKVGSVFSVR